MNETVSYVGEDYFDRKVFKNDDGVRFVDVDGELHTICEYDGFAEPGFPVGISTPKGENNE